MKKICDTEELRKALDAAGITEFIINGEDVKQEDGTLLHVCELFCGNPAAQTIFDQQAARDWKSWRPARDKIIEIEKKSGLTRADRDLYIKVFNPSDQQFKTAKAVEDQLEPLRQKMRNA